MNMIEKILAKASGRKEVVPGDVVIANVCWGCRGTCGSTRMCATTSSGLESASNVMALFRAE